MRERDAPHAEAERGHVEWRQTLLIPAEAGIQFFKIKALGPRRRGDERSRTIRAGEKLTFTIPAHGRTF